jgi:hypothetical protein
MKLSWLSNDSFIWHYHDYQMTLSWWWHLIIIIIWWSVMVICETLNVSQSIWQQLPLYLASYQPPTHWRLLTFPVGVIIIGEDSWSKDRFPRIHQFQQPVRESIGMNHLSLHKCIPDRIKVCCCSQDISVFPWVSLVLVVFSRVLLFPCVLLSMLLWPQSHTVTFFCSPVSYCP